MVNYYVIYLLYSPRNECIYFEFENRFVSFGFCRFFFSFSRSYRFIEEEQIHKPELLLFVGIIGLLVNLIGLVLLYGKNI